MNEICYFNSNDGSGLLGFGVSDQIRIQSSPCLTKLQDFISSNKSKYIFGALNYNLKNEIFDLNSEKEDKLDFPSVLFWIPKYVVKIQNEHFEFVQGEKNEESFTFLNEFLEEETDLNFHHYNKNIEPRTSKQDYITKLQKIKSYLQNGDIYEVNFCQEFFAENIEIPFELDLYFKLNQIAKAPFSSFLKFDEFTVFCNSPERFIQLKEGKLITQPIKGTAARNDDKSIDELNKLNLKTNQKERSENIMIVDLVRNDLSKIAKKNSVHVDELCEIYTFPTVHQMISTVSCIPKNETSFTDIIRATFPMGSMTGAPKFSAMKIIDELEDFNRGLYSGSIGYIDPNGDFDFNVVIRSLIYNSKKKYLSCSVGSAITILSDEEKEYEECQIKVDKLLSVLRNHEH
ncbi:MAG: anthranilate synthase component I family protein [Crocinitomicaceae bacterium]|jgi:para-aminobenzoate synthetase component 1